MGKRRLFTDAHQLTGRHRIARNLHLPSKDHVVLDLGCAYGYFVGLVLARTCRRAYGIDCNVEDIGYAHRHYLGGFLAASATALPFKDACFDAVYAMDLLEHIPIEKVPDVVSEMSRVLNGEGYAVISVPGKFLDFLDPRYPWHRHYSKKELLELFDGFTMIRSFQSGLLSNYIVGVYIRYGVRTLFRLLPDKGFAEGLEERAMGAIDNLVDLDLRINYGIGCSLVAVFQKSSV